ncbi:hypothetical protein NP493_399g03009 [Ridgeia piscesae]|uniref:Uncharacterized protein n=1 Tax=Ridgeia piscesae TaxID=27915 RepID=A0AAD9L1P7_RIDPI|nr:hypothetical protein NP493_399g03009 [Ridgeia piscesae]
MSLHQTVAGCCYLQHSSARISKDFALISHSHCAHPSYIQIFTSKSHSHHIMSPIVNTFFLTKPVSSRINDTRNSHRPLSQNCMLYHITYTPEEPLHQISLTAQNHY